MPTPKIPVKVDTPERLRFHTLYHKCIVSGPNSESLLVLAFQQLCSPNIPEDFLIKWLEDMHQVLLGPEPEIRDKADEALQAKNRYQFVQQCLRAGIIGTMFEVARSHAEERNAVTYRAIQSISYIAKLLNEVSPEFDVHVLKDISANNGIGFLTKILKNKHKIVQRGAAGGCIETLSSLSNFGDDLTIAQIAELLLACGVYTSHSVSLVLHDLRKPENAYMRGLMISDKTKDQEISPRIIKFAPIWLGVTQQATAIGTLSALCRSKLITRKDRFTMLETKPEIIDNLLITISQARPAYYRDRKGDAVAAQILCSLMAFKLSDDRLGSGYTDSSQLDDKDYSIKCNELLLKRPRALELLVRARNIAVYEDQQETATGISDSLIELDSSMREAEERLANLSETTGSIGICTLQLLDNIAQLPGIPPSVYLALLPIAYMACAKVLSPEECKAAVAQDADNMFTTSQVRLQRHIYEIRLKPLRQDDTLVFIPPETTLGPTFLFGLLKQLANAGYSLAKLRRMKEMPPDTPILNQHPTNIIHIHQIVEPRTIGKLIRMSIQRRARQRRLLGNERLAGDPKYARVTYLSAVYLADAVWQFGTHPQNRNAEGVKENLTSLRQAYQELLFNYGNLSETFARKQSW
ncbi:hypothetical protein FRC03_002339, partial [Tulasnella sp. 419]